MTFSAETGEHDASGGALRPRRLGIRAKLFLAFLGFACLILAACAVGWFVFVTIERSVNRVTQESVPGMVDALALAKTVAEISATAPELVASSDQNELTTTKATLDKDLDSFLKVTAALGRTERYGEDGRRVANLALDLVSGLDDLSASVERRLNLKKRREAVSAALHQAHDNFNETLEPLVDNAVFDLVISGEKVTKDNTASINGLVDDGVSRIDHLLSINASVNLAVGLMGEAINATNPDLVEPIHERFLSVSLAIERDLGQLPDNQKTAALKDAVTGLLALGRGPSSLFSPQVPGGDASSAKADHSATAAEIKQKHEALLLLLTPMIDDAAFELVMTTEHITSRGEKAISGLIDGNAEILSLMLTAQAEGNLVASLLSDAAGAADENLLVPLNDRYTASEAKLQGLLTKVEGKDFYDKLSQATDKLLNFGTGDTGMFALRRAELQEAAAERKSLDASRTLSLQLGDRVSGIVATAEAASGAASDSSASAIESARIALALITLLGLAGAGLVMFRYVDPRIIRPIGRITSAMTEIADGDTSVDIPGRDRKDELGDMARALGVFRDTAIAVQEANMREIQTTRQRLADAIESISEGFSLYDAEDRLVISNRRYQQMLYPGMPELIVPGVAFEELLRRVVANGFIVDAQADPEGWIAQRLARRRNPGPSHIQHRSNGRYIMVSERKTVDGGTVAVYSDITELKMRETELAHKSLELERLAGQLAKYLSPQVYESIFTGRQEVKVASRRKKLTVFFSDIVDFTANSEKLQPEDLTVLLNEYLTEMAKIALSYGATIDKYVGDAIVIFFGDPETRGVQQDALNCVEMAIAMRDKMQELQSNWYDRGVEDPVKIRIGINTGYCTVGNFGSEARMEYTIIGASVNLAARLEAAAEHGGILIAYETYALVKDKIHCEPQEPITAKGISRPVATYRVVDTYERLGTQGDILRAEHLNLHLEMNPVAMSQLEREKAEAALRQALERLTAPDEDATERSSSD